MSKRARILVLVVAALGVIGIAAASMWPGSAAGATTATVLREDVEVVVDATGRLEAAVAYEVGPPSVRDFWNYNLSWMIPEGQTVEKGQVVARFDSTQLDEQLRDHRAKLETVQQEKQKERRNLEISLKQLRLDLVKAEGELKVVDMDLSLPEGLVSFIEYERTRLQRDLARRRVEFLKEKIEFEQQLVKTKLELLDVKADYEAGKISYIERVKEKFNVKSPVSGLVVYVPKRNGDRWEVGESVWMLAKILQVADVSTLQVEADVLEVDASRVEPGQYARISVDAIPGMAIESSISEIGRLVRERSVQDPSKVFDAILPLGDIDTEKLRPGMGVQVSIRTEMLPDRLTVPLSAVDGSAKGTFVAVRGTAGRVERRAVSLGQRSGDRVIVEDGLVEGEVVVLDGGRA